MEKRPKEAKATPDYVKCVVPVKTFLYAPETWYHSTCHMDSDTVTLISWAKDDHLSHASNITQRSIDVLTERVETEEETSGDDNEGAESEDAPPIGTAIEVNNGNDWIKAKVEAHMYQGSMLFARYDSGDEEVVLWPSDGVRVAGAERGEL